MDYFLISGHFTDRLETHFNVRYHWWILQIWDLWDKCVWRAPVYSHQQNILAAAEASDWSLLSHVTTESFFSWRRDGCFIPWIHFLITDAETKTAVWGATQRFMGLTHQPGADPALIKVSAAQRSHLGVWSLQQENTTTTFPPCQS